MKDCRQTAVDETGGLVGLDAIGFLFLYPAISSYCRFCYFILQASSQEAEEDDVLSPEEAVLFSEHIRTCLSLFIEYAKALATSRLAYDVIQLVLLLAPDFFDLVPGPADVLVELSKCSTLDLENSKTQQLLFNNSGLMSEVATVRFCVLKMFNQFFSCGESRQLNMFNSRQQAIIFLACRDPNTQCRAETDALLETTAFSSSEALMSELLLFLQHDSQRIRLQAAECIIEEIQGKVDVAVALLEEQTKGYAKLIAKHKEYVQEQENLDPIIASTGKADKLTELLLANENHRHGISFVFAVFFQNFQFDPKSQELLKVASKMFAFVLESGIVDPGENVRDNFLQSGLSLVSNYGEALVSEMIESLQPFMDKLQKKSSAKESAALQNDDDKVSKSKKKKKSKVVSLSASSAKVKKKKKTTATKPKKPKSDAGKSKKPVDKSLTKLSGTSSDWQAEGAIIFLGKLVKYVIADEKLNHLVPQVFSLLIRALESLSPSVYVAAASCLEDIIKLSKEQNEAESSTKLDFDSHVERILEKLDSTNDLEGDLGNVVSQRRGACLGLASMIHRLGMNKIQDINLMETLENYLRDDKNPRRRLTGIVLLDELYNKLGVLFEPYVVQLFANIFLCFGDSKKIVRDETKRLSRNVMKKLGVVGVKLTLPKTIDNLGSSNVNSDASGKQWRVKEASIKLLGSMANLERVILAQFLPDIVPKLIECFADSHPKVR